jgi:putative membrane protein
VSDTQPGARGAPPDPRVRFAAERTLLAWVRTGVAMMGFGFVVARFGWFLREFAAQQQPAASSGWSLALGTGLIVLGVAVNAVAGIGHARFLRRHDRGEPYVAPAWSLGIVVSVLLAVLGIGMAAYLVCIQ